MKIAMIGAGYVGLTTSAGLAVLGHSVICHDSDKQRIARLNAGEIPIYEPGLAEVVAAERRHGRLVFSDDVAEAVGDADAIFLAVGTPSAPDGSIDLSFIDAAALTIAPSLKPGAVVVVKSTVVVGTSRRVNGLIARKRGKPDVSVASNPEFLREGSAVKDFLEPERIVIGTDDVRSRAVLDEIYRSMAEEVPIVATTTRNAELIKYAANAFLALKIGFINDVARLCEEADGDVEAVARGIGLDSRIGSSFLAAGPGFGGSCFPKDTRAFTATGRRCGAPQPLVEALLAGNEWRKTELARRVVTEARLAPGMTVAVLGLAFKAETDDVRESPALTLVEVLQQAGLSVRVHDPRAMEAARPVLAGVEWCATPFAAAHKADAVVVMTEWQEYRSLDLKRLARAMNGAMLFDYRNLFPSEAVTAAGLHHVSLGRPVRRPAAVQRMFGGRAADLKAVAAPASKG
ncbi:MAG: UDP-glucose dehydrogenase family protein [Pararhizobium sp.]